MSKPRYPWWGYVKNVIRGYPALKREYEQLHEQSITARLSGMPVGSDVSRGTESIALRQLPGPKQKEYDAVKAAVNATQRMITGEDRMKVIDLVFWKQSHTLSGAAMRANISYDTAINYHGDFIMLVAYFRELITYEELRDGQKFALKSQKSVL